MAPFSFLYRFEEYLAAEKRFSKHTVTAYLKDVEQFLDFAEIRDGKEVGEASHQLIRSWIVSLSEQKISSISINRKLSTLRTFFKWCQKNGITDHNPLVKIVAPKQHKKAPAFAKENEMVREKMEHIFSDNFDGLRTQLIIELFYQTGMRLSELIELRREHIYGDSLKVLGKRNKERLIPVSEPLRRMIREYEVQRAEFDEKNLPYLFILNNGNKLYPKFVYRKINEYLGTVTSLDKKSPHILRHTFATHMLNNGAALETLREILGHASLSATQVYTHNSFKQLTNIYSQAHPRGHKKTSHGN